MIEITRRLAKQFRSVVRRALEVPRAGPGPALVVSTGQHGLRVRAHNAEAAVEYLVEGERPPDELAVPWELLADVEGPRDEPVTLTMENRGIVASWRDGAVPQVACYPAPAVVGEFPSAAESLEPQEPRLWRALRNAADLTTTDMVRYACHCLQLRGSGQIDATDGRQALVQSGFRFPWTGDRLLPANKLLGCRDLVDEGPILLGATDERITFRLGAWTIQWGFVKDRKFPDVQRQVLGPDAAATRWAIQEPDTQFLLENLRHLPARDGSDVEAITLDLGPETAIRAVGDSRPVELVVRSSPVDGQAIRVATDRQYLVRALRLGLRGFQVYGPESPIFARDSDRTYFWMPLAEESVVRPRSDCVRIESPAADESAATYLPPRIKMPRSKTKSVTTAADHAANGHVTNGQPTNGHTGQAATNGKEPVERCAANGHVAENGHAEAAAEPSSHEALVAEALALKEVLGDALAKTNSLVTMLRRQGRQSRLLRTTLESLRQLQRTAG